MAQNKRIFYAIQAVGLAKVGTNTYTALHGVQSVGINTRLNLEPIFELSQVSLYENVENVPDIEVTMEKVLDGYAPIYCQATNGATSATLVGRSNIKTTMSLAIYGDAQDSASGTAVSQVVCSGMFISQLNWNFPVQGNFTESVTLVGNNKTWLFSGFTFAPTFDNTDEPLAIAGSGGVNRREDLIYNTASGSNYSLFPKEIPGVSSSGTIDEVAGEYKTHLLSARVQTNLGREPLYELGRRGPYHRYIQFPVEVRTDFECYSLSGDLFNALEDSASNVTNQTIRLYCREGTKIDLGTKNKLSSVTYGGGNAGRQGGNATNQYSYLNYNDLTVTHPSDPSAL